MTRDLLEESRGALLDALEALAEHRDAVVIIGAQAIYLRTLPPRSLWRRQPRTAISPSTRDASGPVRSSKKP